MYLEYISTRYIFIFSDIATNCIVKLMKAKSVTNVIYVRMHQLQRAIWKATCLFILIKNPINVITASNHLDKSSYLNGIAIFIIIPPIFLHHHKKKRINVPSAKEHLGICINL